MRIYPEKREEYLEFLQKFEIEYDEKYIFKELI